MLFGSPFQGGVARLVARGWLALGPAVVFTADWLKECRRQDFAFAPQGIQISHGAPLSVVSSVADAVPVVGTSDDVRPATRGGARGFTQS